MKYFIIFIMSLMVFGLTGCDPEQLVEDVQNEIENYDPDGINLTSEYYPDYQDDRSLSEVEMFDADIVCFAIEANAAHPALRMYFFSNWYMHITDFDIYEIQYTTYQDKAMNQYPMNNWINPVVYDNCLIIEFEDTVPTNTVLHWVDGCVRYYTQNVSG